MCFSRARMRYYWISASSVSVGTLPERDLIQECTRAGLAAAASRGRKGGRKPIAPCKVTHAQPSRPHLDRAVHHRRAKRCRHHQSASPVLRCLAWVATISVWKHEIEFGCEQVNHGFEVAD